MRRAIIIIINKDSIGRFLSSALRNEVDCMSGKICCFFRAGENIVQSEIIDSREATLTILAGRYYFYLETDMGIVVREVDHDKIFDLSHLADWTKVTMQLSNKKQKMRIPTQSIMRAVGFKSKDIDLFLDNETKSGLSGKLRKMEWYKNSHPEIQTAALKLFAHLGLFEQQNIKQRLNIVEQVINNFTLLEIHNLFGGLPSGICLKNILHEQDIEQGVDPAVRRRFDPTGKKAIQFFLNNMSSDNFKEVACYALTHYVSERALYESQKQSANAMLESSCALCKINQISSVANLINLQHEKIADTLYSYHNGNKDEHDQIALLQDEIESLRNQLHDAVRAFGDDALKHMLMDVELSKIPFSVEHFKRHHAETHFSNKVISQIAQNAVNAGYRACDEREVIKLCKIYKKAKNAPAKCFNMQIVDSVSTGFTYRWLEPSDPNLYTIAMRCGNTCMRPGFAGESALWESALSDDVAIGAIFDNGQIVAYFRANYDKNGKGIYIDTVESRFLKVLNNEEIWLTVCRAMVEMAISMNKIGKYPVDVVNFREDRGNRLKVQWDRLPISSKKLKAKAYRHPNAPWIYGDEDVRIQKEVWRR